MATLYSYTSLKNRGEGVKITDLALGFRDKKIVRAHGPYLQRRTMVLDAIWITISLAFVGLGAFCVYFFRPRVIEELVLGGGFIGLGLLFGIATVGLDKTIATFGIVIFFIICGTAIWLNLYYKENARIR
ncbi:hypothetical protein KW792_01915 [Candidatus Saccharibacteria bacterium]|nr:hypothetical protein [Candidatus Saccharibacteria bacterium]